MKFTEVYKTMPWELYMEQFLKCSSQFSDYSNNADVKKCKEKGMSPEQACKFIGDKIYRKEVKRITTVAKQDLDNSGIVSFKAKLELLQTTNHLPSFLLERDEIIKIFSQVFFNKQTPEEEQGEYPQQNLF